MIGTSQLVINPLNNSHDRASFACGIEALDSYLKKQANQDVKRRVSKVFVATNANNPTCILGYYTLSSLAIEAPSLPALLAKKLPKHPIPAALLGRLAVSTHMQSRGIGSMLLADALKRTLAAGEHIAIYALIVDAINQQAQQFYESFGFSLLTSEHNRLFLPLKSIP